MGSFMAAALGKLFKENERLVQLANALAVLADGRPSYRERVTSACNGRPVELELQWRITFNSMQDLEDFDATMRAIVEAVKEGE